MRRLILLFLAFSAWAQSPAPNDAKNFVAHVTAANGLLRQNDYANAANEFRLAAEIRPEAPAALLGLIQAYALGGDITHRDAEIEHLRALMEAGKIPKSVRFVRERFTTGENSVVASEYPIVSLSRVRYVFEVFDPHQKPIQHLELVSRERQFSLVSNEKTVRVYARGEPAYEQVIEDVKNALAGRTLTAGKYALAKTPAAIVPMPIVVDDSSDPRLRLTAGQVAIEYIAHSCFRIHTASGARILIDPFASRLWLGYDFPDRIAADAILITHPHYDHDADVLIGHQPPPWASNVRVMRNAGSYEISGVKIIGIAGKHADPWGKEFGQTNTIWLLDVDGLRIAHLGDNGPLTEAAVSALGRVDVLMMPIDAKQHILKDAEIEAIRNALNPKIVIPMHYRIPDLEPSPNSPDGLGEIAPWLANRENVVRLQANTAVFSASTLLPAEVVMVFPHSAKVSAPRK